MWDPMVSVIGSIFPSDLLVVGWGLNGHIGTNVDGYNGVDGGYGCADTNANGERPREFDGEMTLTVTNNCFKRITVNW